MSCMTKKEINVLFPSFSVQRASAILVTRSYLTASAILMERSKLCRVGFAIKLQAQERVSVIFVPKFNSCTQQVIRGVGKGNFTMHENNLYMANAGAILALFLHPRNNIKDPIEQGCICGSPADIASCGQSWCRDHLCCWADRGD